MLSETELDTILESIAVHPDVVESVILSFEGKVIRSNIQNSEDAENFAYWSLNCFMASEMVAKKTPPSFGQLQHISLITTEGGHCLVWGDSYLISTLSKNDDALELILLANKIERLLSIKSGDNNLDFEP